jgi:hypothetical protein
VLDRNALIVLRIILGAILGDFLLNDGRAVMFLLLKFVDMIDYVQFWR